MGQRNRFVSHSPYCPVVRLNGPRAYIRTPLYDGNELEDDKFSISNEKNVSVCIIHELACITGCCILLKTPVTSDLPNQNGTMAKDACCKDRFISAECVRLISFPDKKCGMNFQWVTSSALNAHTDCLFRSLL